MACRYLINFKSKAEREQDEKKYKETYISGGRRRTREGLPGISQKTAGKDEKDLLMCYVHVRDRMTGAGLSFEQVKKETKGPSGFLLQMRKPLMESGK